MMTEPTATITYIAGTTLLCDDCATECDHYTGCFECPNCSAQYVITDLEDPPEFIGFVPPDDPRGEDWREEPRP